MINTVQWVEDLSDYETQCFIQWFNRNGIQTPEDFIKLLFEFDEKKSGGTLIDLLSTYRSIAIERKIQPIPEDLHNGIASALGKLIKRSFEDDILSQTIDLHEYKKQVSDFLKPFGVDTKYLFSYVVNIETEAVEETIAAHSSYWPYSPHKLDNLYTLLLHFQFIDPSGQFKAMFLQKNHPVEYRILWKTNRTDLIYFGYRLYYKIFIDQFLDVIDKLFFIKNRRGDVSNLRDLKKSYYNIKPQIEDNELKANWKRIDYILNKIPLFLPNK